MKTLSPSKIAALLLICGASAFTAWAGSDAAAASSGPKDDGWEIASSLDVAGKNGWTTCGAFAKDLQHRFTLAGGESHIVVYDWTDDAGFGQRHALFVYRDSEGRYWGVDNRRSTPKWLAGTTPAAWVDFWEPDKKSIHLVAEISNPKLLGHTADKSRLDRLTGDSSMVASIR